MLASTFPATAGDGTPSFVADLAEGEAVEFDTTVLVPRVPGAPRDDRWGRVHVSRFRYFPRRYEDLADGAILENLKARPSRMLQVLPLLIAQVVAVRRAIRKLRPDVVHVHWLIPQGLIALLAARRTPWLLTCHGADVYALRGRLAGWLKRRVLARATAVTTVNSDMRQRLIELGADPDGLDVLPMPAALPPTDEVVEAVPGRVLFVGRLAEKKGVAVLLDALAQLPGGLAWSCHVVGDGPQRQALEAQAQRLGPRVSFCGQLPKSRVRAEIAAAQVVVVPSVPAKSGDQDGLPVSLLEALACGRPVVASRLPGLSDAVVDGHNGLLVPAGDASALCDALAALLGDPDLVQRLGEGARASADAFSVERIGAAYRAVLHSLIRAA